MTCNVRLDYTIDILKFLTNLVFFVSRIITIDDFALFHAQGSRVATETTRKMGPMELSITKTRIILLSY